MILIHYNGSWAKDWIEYCEKQSLTYKVIDCYDPELFENLDNVKIVLWAIQHFEQRDIQFSNAILIALEARGIMVFPNYDTRWHFDDKLAQMYLFSSLKMSCIPTTAFYDAKLALKWAKAEDYPIVAKLRRGAGSYNVRKLSNYYAAKRYITRSFGKGHHATPGYVTGLKGKLESTLTFNRFVKRLKRLPNFIHKTYMGRKDHSIEKNYVYFQEFIPDNTHDYRVNIVFDRAWAFRRKVRKNDFRASGSGYIDYDISQIPIDLIKLSFEYSEKLNMQSVAFDFVRCPVRGFLLVEISYGYDAEVVEKTGCFWDKTLNLHLLPSRPTDYILESLIANCTV